MHQETLFGPLESDAAGEPQAPPREPTSPSEAKPTSSRAPRLKKVDVSLEALPAAPGEIDHLDDHELISAYLEARRQLPVIAEIADSEVQQVASTICDQWVVAVSKRALLSFGGFESDMRARANLKAKGIPPPTVASCGDPRFPDPLPTLDRACRHLADNLAHLDGQSFSSMGVDDLNLFWQETAAARDIAEKAGVGEEFPDPYQSGKTLDLSPYREILGEQEN